jgi:4'-phosphopantetheinyl transferase
VILDQNPSAPRTSPLHGSERVITPRPLPRGEVHIWTAKLDAPRSRAALSPDERIRADEFRVDRGGGRYSAARAILRTLLGEYAGIDPAALRFEYGTGGKPSIAIPSGDGRLHFNASHCESVAVYAFTRDAEVGVDVELVQPAPDLDDVANKCFSPSEVAALRSVPAALRSRAFFDCWTRKEAYIKAIGEGLCYPLDGFDVTLAPGDAPRLLSVAGDEAAGARWTMLSFEPLPGFAAAVAIDARGIRPRWCGVV